MSEKFCSFDIFDTCLIRTCGESSNVYLLLAHDVLGREASESEIADFIKIRKEGVRRAKQSTSFDEVTINEIYENCDFSSLTSISSNEILQIELSIEKKVLKPIKKTSDIIKTIRKKGCLIAFVSDMYLPSDFLKLVLEEYDIFQKGDRIYVSGELRKSKRDGTLFKYVRQNLSIQYSNWVHWGDDYIADYLKPKLLGIKAKRIVYKYTKYQKENLNADLELINKYLSITAGLSRSILYSSQDNHFLRTKFATDLIAPLYVPFVYHVLENAYGKGFTDVYFLARDAIIFQEIADEFKNIFPNIKTHILYVSRKSLYLPTLEMTKENIVRMIGNFKGLNKYKTDNFQIDFPLEFLEKENQTKEQIAEDILSSPEICNKIISKSKEQNEICLKYFKYIGLASHSGKNAIVDLGGTRKCQQSINKILIDAGFNPIFAYYLEVQDGRNKNGKYDKYDAVLFKDFYSSNKLYSFLTQAEILTEHYFSIAPLQRTSNYNLNDNKVEVVFENSENDNIEEKKIVYAINSEICRAFAKEYIKLELNKFNMSILLNSARNLSQFFSKPDRSYLKALIGIDDPQNKYVSKPIIDKITIKEILHGNYKSIWINGSIMFTFGPFLYNVYYNVLSFLKKVKKQLFSFR
ncbi:hypothetical protein [Parabacteroides sp.]